MENSEIDLEKSKVSLNNSESVSKILNQTCKTLISPMSSEQVIFTVALAYLLKIFKLIVFSNQIMSIR